tara:strand:- start:1037 stop:1765 length:729 start_codon:yes stop_codon:yes gene_type:complete
MPIQTAKLVVSDKVLTIKTLNWGVVNAVLLFIYYLSLIQKIEDEDLTFYSVAWSLSILLPLLLLKISIEYQRKMVNLCNVVSILHIVACFLRAAISLCDIYEVGDICGECLCGTNTTCIITANNTVFEIDQSRCQDILLEAMFSVCINIFMVGATLQIINGLKSIITSKKMTTVVVNNMDVPDIEENRYIPPYIPPDLEEKSQIPSENVIPIENVQVVINDEMDDEINEENVEGIAVALQSI